MCSSSSTRNWSRELIKKVEGTLACKIIEGLYGITEGLCHLGRIGIIILVLIEGLIYGIAGGGVGGGSCGGSANTSARCHLRRIGIIKTNNQFAFVT